MKSKQGRLINKKSMKNQLWCTIILHGSCLTQQVKAKQKRQQQRQRRRKKRFEMNTVRLDIMVMHNVREQLCAGGLRLGPSLGGIQGECFHLK